MSDNFGRTLEVLDHESLLHMRAQFMQISADMESVAKSRRRTGWLWRLGAVVALAMCIGASVYGPKMENTANAFLFGVIACTWGNLFFSTLNFAERLIHDTDEVAQRLRADIARIEAAIKQKEPHES
jgi:hypothetical protein